MISASVRAESYRSSSGQAASGSGADSVWAAVVVDPFVHCAIVGETTQLVVTPVGCTRRAPQVGSAESHRAVGVPRLACLGAGAARGCPITDPQASQVRTAILRISCILDMQRSDLPHA